MTGRAGEAPGGCAAFDAQLAQQTDQTRAACAYAALATTSTEQRVEKACTLVKRFLSDARYDPSKRLSVAIRFLAPHSSKAAAQAQLLRFEEANGKDAAAAEDALARIVDIVGGHESLDVLVRELAPPPPPPAAEA